MRLLLGEQSRCVLGEFENAHAFVQVALIGHPMQGDLLHQFLLLDTPLFRHLNVEGMVNAAIELVDVHSVNTVLEPFALRLETGNGVVVLFTLIRMAVAQGRADPSQHFLAEGQSA